MHSWEKSNYQSRHRVSKEKFHKLMMQGAGFILALMP
jgi:hypothetical protein